MKYLYKLNKDLPRLTRVALYLNIVKNTMQIHMNSNGVPIYSEGLLYILLAVRVRLRWQQGRWWLTSNVIVDPRIVESMLLNDPLFFKDASLDVLFQLQIVR